MATSSNGHLHLSSSNQDKGPDDRDVSVSGGKSEKFKIDGFADTAESLEASYRSGAPSNEDDILKNLMLRHGQDDGEMINSEEHDTLTELKAVDDARIDTLALKVEELEGRYNREERVMRKLRRQGRILKAQEEYMECLEALASTKVVSDGEFFNVAWKEVELDWGT